MKIRKKHLNLYLKVECFKWHITVMMACFKEKCLFSEMLNKAVKI